MDTQIETTDAQEDTCYVQGCPNPTFLRIENRTGTGTTTYYSCHKHSPKRSGTTRDFAPIHLNRALGSWGMFFRKFAGL